jgi:hypothetical protein
LPVLHLAADGAVENKDAVVPAVPVPASLLTLLAIEPPLMTRMSLLPPPWICPVMAAPSLTTIR